jgi:hypothetical protein
MPSTVVRLGNPAVAAFGTAGSAVAQGNLRFAGLGEVLQVTLGSRNFVRDQLIAAGLSIATYLVFNDLLGVSRPAGR